MITYHLICLVASLAVVAAFFSCNFKVPLTVKPLTPNRALYSDRPYQIQGDHHLIDHAFVIVIPRHVRTPIFVSTNEESTLFRLLSDVNANDEFADWHDDPHSIYAPGSDYEGNENHLTRAVFRACPAGSYKLPPGGPRFAAPVLIKTDGDVTAHTVQFFNKIIGPPSHNKKKLLAATIFVVLANAAAFVLAYAADYWR